jgi:hypothetical protein
LQHAISVTHTVEMVSAKNGGNMAAGGARALRFARQLK